MGKKINLYSTCVALHDRSCSYYKKININVNRCIVVVTDFRGLRRRGAQKHSQWNISNTHDVLQEWETNKFPHAGFGRVQD